MVSGSSSSVSKTFNDAGTYTATVTVTSGRQTESDSASVEVASLEVSASASPSSGEAPLEVTFTASASGGTGSYEYSWSGAVSGSSSSVSKTFNDAGTYTATVTVASGRQTESDSASVVVSLDGDQAPTVTISRLNPPTSPPNDKTFITTDTISLKATVMSGNDDVTSQASITWSGGGTPSTGSGSTFSTKYSTASSHTVTASASYQGSSASATFTLQQDNKDKLRQEYINVYQLTPPGRGSFDQTQPPSQYSRLLDPPDIDSTHQWWIVANLITKVTNLDNKYAGSLRETSGYRCPLGNQRAGGSKLSRHMKGRAADYNQQVSKQNYLVWKASGQAGATEKILYDQRRRRIYATIPEWPDMPPGVTVYTKGHAGW
ncbi:MAG TPA: PKD domain-containing protein [bacterium]|nr:PKD domain-containing protein [bacterium]